MTRNITSTLYNTPDGATCYGGEKVQSRGGEVCSGVCDFKDVVGVASFKRWHLGKELVRDLTMWTSGKAHSRWRDSHCTDHRQEGACLAF